MDGWALRTNSDWRPAKLLSQELGTSLRYHFILSRSELMVEKIISRFPPRVPMSSSPR